MELRDGKVLSHFTTENTANGRTSCETRFVQYQRSEIRNGELYIIEGSYTITCSSGGGFGGGGAGGDYGSGGSGGGTRRGGGGSGPTPGTGGGTGGVEGTRTETGIIRSYKVQTAILEPTSFHRLQMNMNVKQFVEASGLAVDILGFSFDKAEGLARVLGGNLDSAFPLAQAAGKWLGVTGVAIDTWQLYVGIAEDGFTWNEDGWNVAQSTFGLASLAAGTVFAAPWIAASFAVGSVGIYVYNKRNP